MARLEASKLIRRLNAFRKSVGDDIGKQAFIARLSAQSAGTKAEADTNAQIMVDALWPLVREGTLAIPRGGYLIRRGRGRTIVERARSWLRARRRRLAFPAAPFMQELCLQITGGRPLRPRWLCCRA